MSDLRVRELFGGAMTMSMPERFQDVSDFRPVPDHQEVWADGGADQSFVIEIVEAVAVDNRECGEFYFRDLANVNGSSATTIQESVEILAPTSLLANNPGVFVGMASGTQLVSKGASSDDHACNQVLVSLAVVRLPQVRTDLLITLNAPMYINPDSAAAEHAGAGPKDDASLGKPLLLSMLSTLQILDWGLFRAEE